LKTGQTDREHQQVGRGAVETAARRGRVAGDAEREPYRPASIEKSFQGSAQAFQNSLSSTPVLILAALIAVHIILGMLYESTIQPIRIISTLPSAGLEALLTLMPTSAGLVHLVSPRKPRSRNRKCALA
jgi:multidrug efflux pump subunit AcrB